MKLVQKLRKISQALSRPVRGAWIETLNIENLVMQSSLSRPVRGAWIETGIGAAVVLEGGSRAPCGARGLKQLLALRLCLWMLSRPVRGAWIETCTHGSVGKGLSSRAPCGARGLKPKLLHQYQKEPNVAPRAGRVD